MNKKERKAWVEREMRKLYLVHSPDDNGYYWTQDYPAGVDRTSIIYSTMEKAYQAKRTNKIEWR